MKTEGWAGPGPELDGLVCERLGIVPGAVSTDWAAAGRVVARLQELLDLCGRGTFATIEALRLEWDGEEWWCGWAVDHGLDCGHLGLCTMAGRGDTGPLAICRFALEVVEAEGHEAGP